jgi:hypothetical protein
MTDLQVHESHVPRPMRWLATVGLCLLVTGVAYHARLDAYFFQDDLAMIAHGVECWRDGHLYRLFSTDQWDVVGYNRLRPIVLSMFTLLYHAVGLHAVWFRIVNLILHAGSGVLVAWLVRRNDTMAAAWLAAATFLTWPSFSNAVYPVCTMTDLGAGFFALLATSLTAHAHMRAHRATWLWAMPLICLSYLMSQFSKETGIVTVPLVALAGRYLAQRSWRSSIVATLPVALLALVYLLWRRMIFSALLTGGDFNFFALPLKAWIWRYAYFWFEVLIGLNLDDVKAMVGPRGIIAVVGVIFGASALILRQIVRCWRAIDPSPTLQFGAMAFALAILPVVYFPAIRNLYLPLVGISMGIGLGIERLYDSLRDSAGRRKALTAALVGLGLWRVGIIVTCCYNNGLAGDMFYRSVTQLDAISATVQDPNPHVDVFAAPEELLTPFLLDTPWVICGGEAGKYQQLVYGKQRATFRYYLQTSWRRHDIGRPSIALERPRDDLLQIELGPHVEFHWREDLSAEQPFGEVKVLRTRRPYRDPIPDRLEVSLNSKLRSSNHVIVGFDGLNMRVLEAP